MNNLYLNIFNKNPLFELFSYIRQTTGVFWAWKG